MSEKIKFFLSCVLLCILSLPAVAHEDDYIVGLSAFRDGLYEISAPALEGYLAGDTEERKADYSRYLLYRMYLADKEYAKSVSHLKKIDGAKDRRFDSDRMAKDKMLLLTKTDCAGASGYLRNVTDETSFNYFLDSECKLTEDLAKHVASNSKSDSTKLKVVSNFSDSPEMVQSIFDSLDMTKMNDSSKKFFALYFYKHGDMERFGKIRSVYEDADVVGIELDQLWQTGDKDTFLSEFEKFKEKYSLTGVNACRAIDVYKNKKVQFDCDLVNECMQKYSVEFVQVKGACLVKSGDKEKVTAFVDSLKETIFPGMCGYGEYIFYNQLYTGRSHAKFYQCDQRYKIADLLLKQGEDQAVVNMFYKKPDDRDRYYAATALRKLGKVQAADEAASHISDPELKAKYDGGA